jgi:hypothetical protein
LKPTLASPPDSGEIKLGFGGQYAGLVGAGLLGMLPLTTWAATLLVPLDSGTPAQGGDSTWMGVAGGAAALLLVVLPWLVPCLVLRARQPAGARVVWDGDEIVEWDGPWRRAVIHWRQAEAAHLHRSIVGRGGTLHFDTVQIVDSSGAAITVWDERPKGAPVVRRRLSSSGVQTLLAALAARNIVPSSRPDWSRIADPDRPRPVWVLVLGRLGYVFAVAAPLGSPDATWPGLVLGAVGAALLGLRAFPVLCELRATTRRLALTRSGGTDSAPDRTDVASASDEGGRVAALRSKLRAVRLEASVRTTFVVLVVVSTLVGARVFHPGRVTQAPEGATHGARLP